MRRLQLKVAMVKKGITNRELARQVGIHETVMSLVVNGKYNLEPNQESRVAEILERPINELFCRGSL